jgi:hypothetical protein
LYWEVSKSFPNLPKVHLIDNIELY